MILEFINPLLFFILANATSTILFNKKFGKVLPVTFLLIGLVLFISGLVFQTFNIGLLVCLLYALYSLIYIVKNKDDDKKIVNVSDNILSEGLIYFITLYFLIFIFDYNRSLHLWDDFSHWGMMVKEILRLDKFYSVTESNLLVHKDYPPFISLYEMFWIKLSNRYSEATLIRSVHILELSMLIPFIKINDKDKKVYKEIIISVIYFVLSILLINVIDHHRIISSLYVEYVIMFITLYGLLSIIKEEKLTSNSFIINIFVVTLSLALLKQISICFSFMVAAFYFLNVLLRRKQEFKDITDKKEIIIKMTCIVFLFIVIPLLTILMWKSYVSHFPMEKQFVIEGNSFKDFIQKFNLNNEVTKDFWNSVVTKDIMNFRFPCSILGISLVIYAVYLIIILMEKEKKESLIYLLILFLGNIAYLIVILFTYLVLFANLEASTLASFDRYVGSYVLLPIFSMFIVLINKMKVIDYSKQILYTLLVIALLIGFTKSFNDVNQQFISFIDDKKLNYEEAVDFVRENYDKYNLAILSQTEHNEKIKYRIMYYLNDMNINPKKIVTIYIPNSKELNYRKVVDSYLGNRLTKTDYLFVVDSSGLFKEMITKGEKVFKVTYEGDKLLLNNN